MTDQQLSEHYFELAYHNELDEQARLRRKLELALIEIKDLRECLMAERENVATVKRERDSFKQQLHAALGALNKGYRDRAALLDKLRQVEGGLRRIIPFAEMGCKTQVEDMQVWEVKKLVG